MSNWIPPLVAIMALPRESYMIVSMAAVSVALTIYYGTPTSTSPSSFHPFIPVLFLLGPNIVHHALASVAGPSTQYDDVAFSFGWLSYALTSLPPLFSAERKILPEPEIRGALLLNMTTGQTRENRSWLLSRVLKDLESQADSKVEGLCVTVFNAVDGAERIPTQNDFWPNDGFVEQIIVAVIPLLVYGNPMVLLITCLSQLLGHITARLPAWKAEKYGVTRQPRDEGTNYALMRGDGHRHVFVICNKSADAFHLGNLAIGAPLEALDWRNMLAISGLTLGWFVICWLASTVTSNSGYLVAVMTIGTLFNLSHNIPPPGPRYGFCNSFDIQGITLVNASTACGDNIVTGGNIFRDFDTMTVLKQLERSKLGRGMGLALLRTFFPGLLSEQDQKWWEKRRVMHAEHGRKAKAELEARKQEGERAGRVKMAAEMSCDWAHKEMEKKATEEEKETEEKEKVPDKSTKEKTEEEIMEKSRDAQSETWEEYWSIFS